MKEETEHIWLESKGFISKIQHQTRANNQAAANGKSPYEPHQAGFILSFTDAVNEAVSATPLHCCGKTSKDAEGCNRGHHCSMLHMISLAQV